MLVYILFACPLVVVIGLYLKYRLGWPTELVIGVNMVISEVLWIAFVMAGVIHSTNPMQDTTWIILALWFILKGILRRRHRA